MSSVQGMTVAVTQMDAMVAFYTTVFSVKFLPTELYGRTLFNGALGGIKFLFCPADLAGNTASQNRHQLDILVDDIRETIEQVKAAGGSLMGELVEDESQLQIAIKDPDDNSLTLIQNRESTQQQGVGRL